MTEEKEVCATMSVAQAAKRMGLGLSLTYAAARSGEIPTIKIGGRILVPTAALDRLLSGE